MAYVTKRVQIDKNKKVIEKGPKVDKEADREVILKISELEKAFGNDTLFDKADLIIHKGDKVA